MSEGIERQQTWGVIDSLGDPSASIVENYVLKLEAQIESLEIFRRDAKVENAELHSQIESFQRENEDLIASIKKREPWFGAWLPDTVYQRLKSELDSAYGPARPPVADSRGEHGR